MSTLQFLTNAIYAIVSGCVNTPATKLDYLHTKALRATLDDLGFETYIAVGSYLGNLEPSILVILKSADQLSVVLDCARFYQQKQVFFANQGVFTAPYLDKNAESYSATNAILTGAEAMSQDSFTEVASLPEGSIIFSVPDLYHNERNFYESQTKNAVRREMHVA